MKSLLRWYLKNLRFHPWKTQLLTTGILMASSDVIAQTYLEERNIFDLELQRVARFGCLGFCYVAPVLRVWYTILEKNVVGFGRNAGLVKMCVDQAAFTPVFLASFLIVAGMLQFQPWNSIKKKMKEDYFTILKQNYRLWPAAQLITFYVIPFYGRVIFVSSVALIWNTYLAYRANSTIKKVKA